MMAVCHHVRMPRKPRSARSQSESLLVQTLIAAERDYIAKVLAQHNGNRTHAAKALGIARRTLLNKIAQHGLT